MGTTLAEGPLPPGSQSDLVPLCQLPSQAAVLTLQQGQLSSTFSWSCGPQTPIQLSSFLCRSWKEQSALASTLPLPMRPWSPRVSPAHWPVELLCCAVQRLLLHQQHPQQAGSHLRCLCFMSSKDLPSSGQMCVLDSCPPREWALYILSGPLATCEASPLVKKPRPMCCPLGWPRAGWVRLGCGDHWCTPP